MNSEYDVSPTIVRLACHFALCTEDVRDLASAEWDQLYPTVSAALEKLRPALERQLSRVRSVQKSLANRPHRPRHWLDLAPHSSVSVTAAQRSHMEHVVDFVETFRRHVLRDTATPTTRDTASINANAAHVFSSSSMSLLPRSPLESPLTSGSLTIREREESPAVSADNDDITTMHHAIARTMSRHAELFEKLRQCVESEHDLKRRDTFARIAERTDAFRHGSEDVALSSSRSIASSSIESRSLTRSVANKEALQAVVRELSDATGDVGRKVRAMSRSVDAWLWEGFSGPSVADRVSCFVDECIAELRERFQLVAPPDEMSGSASLTVPASETSPVIADDVLIAAVEDELYCYDEMFLPLHEALMDPDGDELVGKLMADFVGAPPATLHVPPIYQPVTSQSSTETSLTPYCDASATLRTMPLFRTPTRKLLVVKSASRQLMKEMKRVAVRNGVAPDKFIVGGDDFVPMFMYIVVQSGVPCLATEVALIRHGMAHSLRQGELGYYCTSLEIACEFTKNMAQSGTSLRLPMDADSQDDGNGEAYFEGTRDQSCGDSAHSSSAPLLVALVDHVFTERWVGGAAGNATAMFDAEGPHPFGHDTLHVRCDRPGLLVFQPSHQMCHVLCSNPVIRSRSAAAQDAQDADDKWQAVTVSLVDISHLSAIRQGELRIALVNAAGGATKATLLVVPNVELSSDGREQHTTLWVVVASSDVSLPQMEDDGHATFLDRFDDVFVYEIQQRRRAALHGASAQEKELCTLMATVMQGFLNNHQETSHDPRQQAIGVTGVVLEISSRVRCNRGMHDDEDDVFRGIEEVQRTAALFGRFPMDWCDGAPTAAFFSMLAAWMESRRAVSCRALIEDVLQRVQTLVRCFQLDPNSGWTLREATKEIRQLETSRLKRPATGRVDAEMEDLLCA